MHSCTIQYIMPNSGTYQFLAGIIHNLVYTAAMTVDFNINMIVWNLDKKGT